MGFPGVFDTRFRDLAKRFIRQGWFEGYKFKLDIRGVLLFH